MLVKLYYVMQDTLNSIIEYDGDNNTDIERGYVYPQYTITD